MDNSSGRLVTPVYLKVDDATAWPADKVFHLLTASGLFLCRNHQFFDSCVPAARWPTELADHKAFLKVRYPKIPRSMLEHVVGFFSRVADVHNAEAAVLVVWDAIGQRLRIIVPDQSATVSRNYQGKNYPIGVEYETPTGMPVGWTVIGDIHSHVDYSAYASYTDKHDEQHRAGLHIVVGRIRCEPPEFHIEAVVDGARFSLPAQMIMEGYDRRRIRTPPSWMSHIKIITWSSANTNQKPGYGYNQISSTHR
jgi:hypothetical protein